MYLCLPARRKELGGFWAQKMQWFSDHNDEQFTIYTADETDI